MLRLWLKIGFFLIVIGVLACRQRTSDDFTVTNLQEIEPNDERNQAQVVTHQTAVRGYLNQAKDQDWYRIAIPPDSGRVLRAQLSGIPSLNLKIELFDQANTLLIEADKNKENAGEIIANYNLTAGDYFVRVRELWLKDKATATNDSVFYVLKILLLPVTGDFEVEPNNRGVDATPISAGHPRQGYLSPYLDEDWFKFEIPTHGNYYLSIGVSAVDGVDTKLAVLDPIQALITEKDVAPQSMPEVIPNLGLDTTKEFYYLVVKSSKWQSNEDQTYELKVDLVPVSGMVEIEPNDRMVRATPLARHDTVRGFIESAKDLDWYQYTNQDSTAQILHLQALSVKKIDLTLGVFNEEEQELMRVNDTGEREPEFILNLGVTPQQTYFIKVQNNLKTENSQEPYTLIMQTDRYYNDEEFEPNPSIEHASPLFANKDVTGFIYPRGDEDFYQLDLLNYPKARVDLTLKGILKVNTNFSLYDRNLTEIAKAAAKPAEELEKISTTLNAGTYFIKVYAATPTESNYRDRYKLSAQVRPVY